MDGRLIPIVNVFIALNAPCARGRDTGGAGGRTSEGKEQSDKRKVARLARIARCFLEYIGFAREADTLTLCTYGYIVCGTAVGFEGTRAPRRRLAELHVYL